jgi:hypothetical protein
MDINKKHWLTNGAERVNSGDLVRFRGDDGEWGEWASADHLAGSRVDSFAQWYGMGVQFARVPNANIAEQPQQFQDQLQRWQQESAPALEGSEWITDPTAIIQRGDLYRVREDSHHDYCNWQSADHYVGTEAGYFEAWHSRDIQFCRPAKPAAKPAPEQPPAPTTDRGERYRRTITQSLPGDTGGLSITVDIADVCEAFQLTYMLAQAAKKIMLPGERGSKGRLRDLREAAWHIQRQIQIEEARQQEQSDL